MGVFKKKGQGAIYDQVKKNISVSITPDGLAGIDELAQDLGLSRSEFIEQVGRKRLRVVTAEDLGLTTEEQVLLGKASPLPSIIGSG